MFLDQKIVFFYRKISVFYDSPKRWKERVPTAASFWHGYDDDIDEDDDNEDGEHEFDDYKNTPTAASFGWGLGTTTLR